MGNLWVPISQVLPIRWVLLHLPYHGKLMWKPMHFPHSDIGSFFLWLRVNMYYFHTCIYINPILLWQSLSSRCVVDHLWNLHYALCFAFWAHFFHVQCATVQVYGLPQSHCDDNRRAYCFHITYIYIYHIYYIYAYMQIS